MTQLAVSDELASALAAKAASRRCTPDDLLQSMLVQLESDEAFAERLLTPELQARFESDLAKVDAGNFLTEEEVDSKFEALFRNLESR